MIECYLKDIKHELHPEDNVSDWDFVYFPDKPSRLYYKPFEGDGQGFCFYAVESVGRVVSQQGEDDHWNKDLCIVECIVSGVAYFDGIRHLYYGDENTSNYGYHYYPNLEMIIETITALRFLEKKYCRDCE